jgi:hypothetical protein
MNGDSVEDQIMRELARAHIEGEGKKDWSHENANGKFGVVYKAGHPNRLMIYSEGMIYVFESTEPIKRVNPNHAEVKRISAQMQKGVLIEEQEKE